MLSMWQHARRILAVRLDSAGDVLMTTPALRALKESGGARRVALLAWPARAAGARRGAAGGDIIEFSAPWMKPALADPAGDRALINRIAGCKFDAAVVFTVFSQNPLPAACIS